MSLARQMFGQVQRRGFASTARQVSCSVNKLSLSKHWLTMILDRQAKLLSLVQLVVLDSLCLY